jgi:hypothetical protein
LALSGQCLQERILAGLSAIGKSRGVEGEVSALPLAQDESHGSIPFRKMEHDWLALYLMSGHGATKRVCTPPGPEVSRGFVVIDRISA